MVLMLDSPAVCFLCLATRFYITYFAKYMMRRPLVKSIEQALLDTPAASLTTALFTKWALNLNNIRYIGELVQYTQSELEKLPRLGPRNVDLLRDELLKRGLDYGMKLLYVPPDKRKP